MKLKQVSFLLAFAMLGIRLGVAADSKSDSALVETLGAYSEIQKALAADTLQGVSDHAQALAKASSKITDAKAKKILKDEALQLERLTRSGETEKSKLAQARERFKKLSAPLVKIVQSKRPEGWIVVSCSMAKADWIQKDGPIRNPYYGKEMLSCGEKAP